MAGSAGDGTEGWLSTSKGVVGAQLGRAGKTAQFKPVASAESDCGGHGQPTRMLKTL